jgi:predicted regulator of Ras-like GTPase activity (Roadblock/LC7/MglB family)
MDQPRSDAANSALEELLEVSPQVEAAVIITRADRHLIAFAPSLTQGAAEQFATHAGRMLDAAEQARTELGREPVVQVEVATPDGHVFVTADAHRVIAAVTSADPTVGLVFYDLKSALRTLREAGSDGHTLTEQSNLVVPLASKGANGSDAAAASASSDDEDSADGDGSSTSVKAGRWRRRKQ